MTKIAFLGLGIMGSRMAANLTRADYELTVWNRTTSTAESFAAEHGCVVATSPREAAAGAEIVFSMVVDGPQVEQVLLGEDGAAAGASPGTLFVDCSTIGPDDAIRIGTALRERGFGFLDAPVTGSSPRAQDGTLTFMIGGSDEDFAHAKPAIETMGRLIIHAGQLGHGQLIKVINNALAAINATALGQALLVAARAGASLDALLEAGMGGSGGSTMMNLKSGPMREHDYTPLFKLDHMLKDVRLCLDQARAEGMPFPFAQETERVLATASELGFGEDDFAALIEALEAGSGYRL